jgi:hypothetical protein
MVVVRSALIGSSLTLLATANPLVVRQTWGDYGGGGSTPVNPGTCPPSGTVTVTSVTTIPSSDCPDVPGGESCVPSTITVPGPGPTDCPDVPGGGGVTTITVPGPPKECPSVPGGESCVPSTVTVPGPGQ